MKDSILPIELIKPLDCSKILPMKHMNDDLKIKIQSNSEG